MKKVTMCLHVFQIIIAHSLDSHISNNYFMPVFSSHMYQTIILNRGSTTKTYMRLIFIKRFEPLELKPIAIWMLKS